MKPLSQLRRGNASSTLVLAIVCSGVVLASLDLFIVNIALPAVGRDLHVRSLGSLSWVLDGYAIVYASLLVLFGRLAERSRRDNGFLAGVLLFTVASAACGAAPNLASLVAFRVVQAAGAALLTPASLSLVLATAPPERRQASVRTWTALGGLAAALGPVAGGLLVAAGWRLVFFVNVPIGLLALAVGWRRLPAVAGHPVPRPDAFGAALLTAGVGALTLGLVEGNSWGWASAGVLVVLVAAAILLAGFALHTARHSNPLFDPALLHIRPFAASAVVALSFSVAFGAMLLSIVLWEQDVWHWSALRSGLAIAPGPLMVPLVAFLLTGRLTARFGPGRVIAAGSTVYAIGIASWAARAGLRPDYAGQVLVGMLLTGTGVGLTLPTFMAAGASSLPPAAYATGSAVLNMLRQVGLAIGVAVLIAVLGTPHDAAGALRAFQHGWIVTAALAAGAAVAGLTLLRPEPARVLRPEPGGVLGDGTIR